MSQAMTAERRDFIRALEIGACVAGARLSMLRARLHHFERISAAETLAQAVREIAPEDIRERIYARQQELREERGGA
jgi:hypothetical protein